MTQVTISVLLASQKPPWDGDARVRYVHGEGSILSPSTFCRRERSLRYEAGLGSASGFPEFLHPGNKASQVLVSLGDAASSGREGAGLHSLPFPNRLWAGLTL